MSWRSRLLRRDKLERDLDRELQFHIAERISELVGAGLDEGEARRRVRYEFGGIEQVKEQCREARGTRWLQDLNRDLHFAIRTLRTNVGFTAVGIATLVLGIGSTTAMFTIMRGVLWRPLPYPEADRLVTIGETDAHGSRENVAPADFADWKQMNSVFSGIAGYVGANKQGGSTYDLFLTGAGQPVRLKGLSITSNLFEVLGISPMLGRTFADEEFYEATNQVAILSFDCWRAQFGADPNIVGRVLILNGIKRTVVGVMPRGFFFPSKEVQVYAPPMGMTRAYLASDRVNHWMSVIARLAPGVSFEQARAQMTAVASRLKAEHPSTNREMVVWMANPLSVLSGDSRPAVLLLFCALLVLFLIVCLNIGNLQLARGTSRSRELAIRQALGAGSGRLVRQLLTESALISALGGFLGLGFAASARAVLLRYAPEFVPPYAYIRIDTFVCLFAAAISGIALVLFGLGPALVFSRHLGLRDRRESSSRAIRIARQTLIAGEIALSIVLAVNAGLLIHSFIRLERVDLGFHPEHAVSFRLRLPDVGLSNDAQTRAFSEIEAALSAQPDIRAVGANATPLLYGSSGDTIDASVEGRTGYERALRLGDVTPNYFRAMGIPLLRGRPFTEFDNSSAPLVAVVNATLEKAYFHGDNPIGKRIRLGRPPDRTIWVTVVGVVADHKQDRVDLPIQPSAYVALKQHPPSQATFVLRGRGEPGALVNAARFAVRSVAPNLALVDMLTLDHLVQESVGGQRFRTSLVSTFAIVALLLASSGVYGIVAHLVAQRTNEIGIRMALGASPRNVMAMVLGQGMQPILVGSVAGFMGAYFVSGLFKTLLFGVETGDLPAYLMTAAVLVAAALCACIPPASQAIRVDPVVALRHE